MYITDDPLRDADRYDAECSEMDRNAPKCIVCGDIDAPYMIDGERYCRSCLLAECYAGIPEEWR